MPPPGQGERRKHLFGVVPHHRRFCGEKGSTLGADYLYSFCQTNAQRF
jgi:hypothetical protein